MDALLAQPVPQQLRGEPDLLGGDAAGRTPGEAEPQLPRRRVECDPREQCDPLPRLKAVLARRPVDQIDQAAVLDLDTLGRPVEPLV